VRRIDRKEKKKIKYTQWRNMIEEEREDNECKKKYINNAKEER
jgi:hypothetical protein